jgi:hypothetical protein
MFIAGSRNTQHCSQNGRAVKEFKQNVWIVYIMTVELVLRSELQEHCSAHLAYPQQCAPHLNSWPESQSLITFVNIFTNAPFYFCAVSRRFRGCVPNIRTRM